VRGEVPAAALRAAWPPEEALKHTFILPLAVPAVSRAIGELAGQSLVVEALSLRVPEERFFMESWSFSLK